MKSYLLCCKQIKGRHIRETIHLEYEHVLDYYGIEGKVFKAITDTGSNMVKAFNVTFEELNDVNDNQSDEEEEKEEDAINDSDTDDSSIDFESVDQI